MLGEEGLASHACGGGRPIDAAQIVPWNIGERTAVVADLATGEYLVALWVTRTQSTDAAIHCRDVHAPEARSFGEGLAVCDIGACSTARSWRPLAARLMTAVSGL